MDVTSTISTAVVSLLPTILTVGALGIGVAASLFGLAMGWRFFYRILSGDGNGDGIMRSDRY